MSAVTRSQLSTPNLRTYYVALLLLLLLPLFSATHSILQPPWTWKSYHEQPQSLPSLTTTDPANSG
jgi:hypothetical protein